MYSGLTVKLHFCATMKLYLKALPVICAFFLIHASAAAQYYYNDILNINKSNEEYNRLRKANYKIVTLESFEADDSPSEGFFCERKLNADYSESVMVSKSNVTGEAELKSMYQNGRLEKTVSTTTGVTNITQISYDSIGRIQSIAVSTSGNADSSLFVEERAYEYGSDGKLKMMTRTKNGKVVSLISFKYDDAGNLMEETPDRPATDRRFYYYYDDKNRLTDVVRFNERAKRLLPDYMFLYSEDRPGFISQMITVDESAQGYLVWRYAYTAEGLPEIQKCYSKDKQLVGTIQYEYR